MVNTRRTESNGSPSTRPHRTRGSAKLEQDSGSSSEKEESYTGSEDDSSDNSPLVKPQQQPKRKGRPPRVGPKVVAIGTPFKRNFNTLPIKTTHKAISLQRRALAVYAKRKMDDGMEIENGRFSSEDFYSDPRRHRANHLIRKKRMLRRTALSLRPISQKCYADQSPIHFDTDSDGNVLRRTTRRSSNMSWLTDNQMHKVGYPNLNAGYSEEDSRDAADVHEAVELSQRVTRHSNRGSRVRPTYYYEEYVDPPNLRQTRRSVKRGIRVDRRETGTRLSEANTKEHNQRPAVNGRTRSSKIEEPKEVKQEPPEDDSSKSGKENEIDNCNVDAEIKQDPEMENGKGDSSDSEAEQEEVQREIPKRGRRPRVIMKEQFNQRESSSESEEEGRKYSLRNRPPRQPKPAPKAMQTSVLRNERRETRRRRHYTRHVKDSSSSDSSSSSDDRCRKSSKPPKSPHSKNERMKSGAGGSSNIIPIKPETLDQSVRFNSIGGLDSHIQCLKEMVLLPMMYPEVFRQFQVSPPKGVLFHGPPGTGKTLVSRALANECSFGTRKVSFFMRKGADLLSKWIGESEKQLRLLFEQAAEMKPSIIFFDELDGLAPVRSSRQDQVHASIVSTLLALMDGLDDRGDVIVIGATNRIDAIDPALRRPGRFDRELYFPLPSKSEREEILKVHVAAWSQPPTQELLKYLAENTVGYCGSDLRALCSEAVIQSFRRTYPQVYDSEHRLLLNPENVRVEKVDFLRAKSMLVPASHRVASGLGKKLLPILEPVFGPTIKIALSMIEPTFPHGVSSTLSKVKLSASIRPSQLLLTGDGPEHGQTNHVAPALLFAMEHIHAYLLDLTTLYREPGRSPEEACIQVFNEAKRNIPSIIYIPRIDHWWELVSETVKAILVSQLSDIDPNIPILFLASSDVVYNDLPPQLQGVFSTYRKEIYEVKPPNAETRELFFKPLLIDTCLKPPRPARDRPKTPPPLPRAPTPPPSPLSEAQAKKLYETEEHTLRELRIFLRDMCKKLANNKLFFMFTKPVDTEEVPDYTEIIKQPMDLETMMTKVDFHRYECAKDFLRDIDLICQNALEYNPAKSSADKQIRHRACSLRDYAYTLIKTEMDSDFEDKCQDIKIKRKQRKACTSKYLPPYIITPDENSMVLDGKADEASGSVLDQEGEQSVTERSVEKHKISPIRKRKFGWQQGYLKRKKRTKMDNSQVTKNKDKHSSDESKENDPDSSTVEIQIKNETSSPSEKTTALTINCDTQMAGAQNNSPQSSKRRLTDLMSPSELLDSPLYFDDVDQALNENATENPASVLIECSEVELETLLEKIVKITEGFSVTHLLDLHNQFSSIIKKFLKTNIRHTLPKELAKEFLRFKKSMSFETSPNSSKSTSE